MRTQPRLSRRKRLAFGTIVLLLAYTCLELGSALILILFHGGIGISLHQRDNTGVTDSVRGHDPERPDILHPYVGFVRQPDHTVDDSNRNRDFYITEFGFHDTAPPLHKRTPDRVIVGILGGSVAEQIATAASNELELELRKSPEFAQREFVFVRLALAGHKQPQQLMTVSYLLTLGAEFDILISLDGFNEVALPIAENIRNGVHPAYPRSWHTKIVDVSKPRLLRLVGHMTQLRLNQHKSAEFFGRAPLRYSLTATLLWKISHESTNRAILKDMHQVSLVSRPTARYGATGPEFVFTEETELYEHCVAVWSRSSEMLHQLCAANGIRFFQFLQPNQYLQDSKPMDEQERAIAINFDQPYREPVIHCYPLLIREVDVLRERGVRAHDLTQLFAEHREPVYIDDCCHFDQEGCSILARAIGAAIREDSI